MREKQNSSSSTRKNITFNLCEPLQKECFDLISKMGRRQGQELSIIVHKFLETFGISDVSKLSTEQIHNLVTFYSAVQNGTTLSILPSSDLSSRFGISGNTAAPANGPTIYNDCNKENNSDNLASTNPPADLVDDSAKAALEAFGIDL